jgi:predicted NBD/HSP70 family sugar kinase
VTGPEPGALRAASIRERNEQLVLRLIFRNGPLSQSRAALLTGLKPPTVFRIFAELERSGLISADTGRKREVSDRKGRRPLDYRVVPDAAYTVGVDFWISSAAVIIQDFSAKVVFSRVVPFADPPDAESALGTVATLISQALLEAKVDTSRVIGIGVGAPGSVGIDTGIIHYYSRIPGMNNFPLGERLEKAFGVPVNINNNATVVAIAEHRYGAAMGGQSVFAFLIRAGVGGAYLQNGLPVSDHGRTAFEVGHLSMDTLGPLCSCGNRGCLENYLSEDSVLKALAPVADCADLGALDSLLRSGDEHVERALEPLLAVAAQAVRDIRRLLAPEIIIFVTRSAALSDRLAAAAASDFARDDERFGPKSARILGAAYDPLVACRAACDLAYDAFFSRSRDTP